MKTYGHGRCTCGKVIYGNRNEAKVARRQVRNHDKRVYECLEHPGRWHIGGLADEVSSGTVPRAAWYRREPADPKETKETIKRRSGDACEVCGGAGYEMSHRRSRRVTDPHTHCPCNILWTCRTCHSRMHDNPDGAYLMGHHASQWIPVPSTVPARLLGSWWLLTCDGTKAYLDPEEVTTDGGRPERVGR